MQISSRVFSRWLRKVKGCVDIDVFVGDRNITSIEVLPYHSADLATLLLGVSNRPWPLAVLVEAAHAAGPTLGKWQRATVEKVHPLASCAGHRKRSVTRVYRGHACDP